jgi:hypothetical protein
VNSPAIIWQTKYTLKKGDIYACGKGTTDIATNTSKGVGVHRIAMLVPA